MLAAGALCIIYAYVNNVCYVGKNIFKMLRSGASPRVALLFGNKEPNFAWVPADLAAMDAAPSVI